MDLIPKDLSDAYSQLETLGAVAIPCLHETHLEALLGYAKRRAFTRMPRLIAGGKVQQDLLVHECAGANDLFIELAQEASVVLEERFRQCSNIVFHGALTLNAVVLQQYPAYSMGITPHVDGKSMINLVVVVVLEDGGEFYLCRDRNGNFREPIPARAGEMILMRGNLFNQRAEQPMHGVDSITSRPRLICSMRQKVRS